MSVIDGKTISNNTFSGNIGKLVPIASDLKIATNVIQSIDVEIDLLDIDEGTLKNSSSDQRYLYRITKAIKDKIMPDDSKEIQLGPHNQAHWLNFASRLCRIWCSHHGLNGSDAEKLKHFVQFCVVYTLYYGLKLR
nr:uncharacterized protein LOC124813233 [Hydra vulgaris]